MYKPKISLNEFNDRVKNTQKLLKENGIDLLLAYGNESEPQFVRYLSNYWPSFEAAGVLIAQEGNPLLLIGPESMTYAKDRSVIPDIRRLSGFRESSNPEYPGQDLDSFDSIIDELMKGRKPKNIAIAGYNLITKFTYDDLEKAVKSNNTSIVPGDDVIMQQRIIKSPAELECMREAARITKEAFEYTLENIRPGMTELQVRGLANTKLFELGAESEAYPIWILSGDGSNQAISRARHKTISENEMVHLQIGARYEGYASTIGRPVIIGEPKQWMIDAIEAGYQGYDAICSQLYAGNNAGNVAKSFYDTMENNGYSDWLLYGPCHGTGLMEGEPPWIESNSDYIMQENQTYCICLFMGNDQGYGFRLEDQIRVGKEGPENLTNFRKEVLIKRL